MGVIFSTLFQIWPWQNNNHRNGSEFPDVLETFFSHLKLTMTTDDLLQELNRCTNHADEIKLLVPLYKWDPPNQEYKKKYKKNSWSSLDYSEKASFSLKSGDLKDAIQNSHLCLTYATNEKDFARAHYIRAKLLYFMKDVEGSVEEISMALHRYRSNQNTPTPTVTTDEKDDNDNDNDNDNENGNDSNVKDDDEDEHEKTLTNTENRESNKKLYKKNMDIDNHGDDKTEDVFTEWSKLKMKYEDELDQRQKSRSEEEAAFLEKCGEERRKRQVFSNELFKLKSSGSPIAPALEDFIDIKYNPLRGRHLILKKDIPIGTTLLVEKPFVTNLNGTLVLDLSHCYHCLKINMKFIPCPGCVFALFCDEKCLSAAFSSYHKYECPCLPELRAVLTDQKHFDGVNFHMAFKLICKIGPNELFRLYTDRDEAFFPKAKSKSKLKSDPEPRKHSILGIDPQTNTYSSSSYLTVFHLNFVKKREKSSPLSTPEPALPLVALILTQILDQNTHFFTKTDENLNENHNDNENDGDNNDDSGNVKDSKNKSRAESGLGFREFIAEILLHHFHCIRNNVYSLWEMEFPFQNHNNKNDTTDKEEDDDEEEDEIPIPIPILKLEEMMKVREGSKMEYEMNLFARGIFPSASLLSHSCDPNVMMFPRFLGDEPEIAMVNVKTLKKGEELLIFYCPPFPDQSREERRERLLHIYNFHCDCVACLDQWPMMNELELANARNRKKISCSPCSALLFHEMKTRERMLQLLLDGENGFQCPSCLVHYREQNILDEFSRHKRALYTSLRNVNSNQPLVALNSLKSAMEFFETNIISPFGLQILIQKFYITALQLVVHFSR